MLLPLSWLREFVPYEGTAEALGERLTMLGLELDGLNRPYQSLAPIVVGHVLECTKHPEADKLFVTRVDVGDETLDIVCGAPNVAQGQKVAVIKVGNTLPGGLTIKSTQLRGLASNGMICSEAELGLSDDQDGILVLDAAAFVGKSILDILPLEQEVLDISITPNRGDCLSILGIAREVAAAYKLPLIMPSATMQEAAKKADSVVSVALENFDLAPAYFGRVLEDVHVRKSPALVRYRLAATAVRSISNLVDITNYILMELGQPLHAFDLSMVKDARVIVRPARHGEKFVTLDGQERLLEKGDILIADSEKILGLGGIMGGQDSEITTATSRVFLEGAVFSPGQIRRTKRRLGLNSEAAFRFERGVDQTLTPYALNRAAALMVANSGGSLLQGVVGFEAKPWNAPRIFLSQQRAEELLGVELSEDFCETTLQSLGCFLEKSGDEWIVTPPCRPDLTREVDLIEELARVYGVDKIPAVIPSVTRQIELSGLALPLHNFLFMIKHWAVTAGLNEAINYSFTSHKILDILGIAVQGCITLENPLSEDLAVLRPDIAPGLFTAMGNSVSQGAVGVRIFEVAGVFHKDSASETTTKELQRLGVLLTGAQHDRVWPNTKGDLGYANVKGIAEHLFAHLGISEVSYELSTHAPEYLLPAVTVKSRGETLGYLGQVRPAVADHFEARKEVWYAEFCLNSLYRLYLAVTRKFTPLTIFPPVRRDVTFIAPFGVISEAIRTTILGLESKLLEDVVLIDVFDPLEKEERHMTFRLTFRHAERTLKENEADKQRDSITAEVCKKLNLTV